jgi:hypothetical protein
MGISTPVGTRRRRGLDGQAMVDRGGGQSSLTRGRSRCGGEERRGVAGAMWRGGDGGAFYRGWEAVVGRGDGRPSSGRRCAIKASITRRGDNVAATIDGEIEEESVHQFSSIRVRKGDHQRHAERQRQPRVAAWPSARGGRRPEWARVGPSFGGR